MGDLAREWTSFWDIASPQYAARMLTESYGGGAGAAAAHCADAAEADGRQEDHQFWRAVLDQLKA
jgi:hypothetical protein